MRRVGMYGLIAATLSVAACAYYDEGYGYGYGPPPPEMRFGDFRYEGSDYLRGRWRGHRAYFRGRGADLLDPWLAFTPEGRRIVSLGFSEARNGRIREETAERANIWFRRYADSNFDLCLTDEEIRIALVQASREHDWGAD